jgi:hypothetical protein
MKKMLIFGLALLLLSSMMFAEDAKVMPMMVGRLYVAPLFSFAPGSFDKDGTYEKYNNGVVKAFNMGLVLEYGVISWISAAIQWTPGWTPVSDAKPAAPASLGVKGDVNSNGFADIFAGFKIQLAGEKAPVKTSMFRFSVAPGVVIPIKGPDFNHEVDIINNGDPATIKSMDKHVFALGGRVYFDYLVNKNFFINIYNETMFYPVDQDLNRDGPTLAFARKAIPAGIAEKAGAGAGTLATNAFKDTGGEVNYNYRTTFELEPVFTMPITKGLSFTAGLPLNYRYIPEFNYYINNLETPTALAANGINLRSMLFDNLNEGEKHILTLNPNITFFITSTPLPLEFKFIYSIPVYGENTPAMHYMMLQVRAYFALPGRPQ